MRKVAIFKNHSKNNENLALLTLPNHFHYATEHGYDLIILPESYDTVLKNLYPLIKYTLQNYEAIVTIGSDVIFTNMAKPITDFIDTNYGAVLSEEAICKGGCNINNDVLIINNNKKGLDFCDLIIESEPISRTYKWGMQEYLQKLISEGYKDVKILPVRQLQSTFWDNCPMKWEKGDFILHCFGTTPEIKYNACKLFLETGTVDWIK